MNWTPQALYGAVLHITALAALVVVVLTHNAPWAEVSNAFYALVGLGIGVAVTPAGTSDPPSKSGKISFD